MSNRKKIYFTVTNDLTYDQRMQRICRSLANNGYEVTLVGVYKKTSRPLGKEPYQQKRIRLLFKKGKLFYAEYMFRVFWYLAFKKMDAICAIDLDSIVPCYYISRIKKIQRIYDAHELFTEMKEVATRPAIQRAWLKIEKHFVPKYPSGYTVSASVAEELKRRYASDYPVIRNITALRDAEPSMQRDHFILYQGAVNEARGFESLIPAMKTVTAPLIICGDGNYMETLKELIKKHEVQHKVTLHGMLAPEELIDINAHAKLGIALIENEGKNQYFSLANKFFDYIHAGLPQITMDFPEYRAINEQFRVAELVSDLYPEKIAAVINNLLEDGVLYKTLQQNCLEARKKLNWQQEEQRLLHFYEQLFSH